MPRLSVKLDGMGQLRQKMADGGLPLYQKPIQRVMREGADFMHATVQTRAPGSITSLATVRPVTATTDPLGVGRVKLTAGPRARVAAILNGGGRGKRQRWRQGPRQGVLARRWFHGVVKLRAVKSRVDQLMQQAAREIEQRWASNQ